MSEYKTTLQRREDKMLDHMLESRRVITEALDYIEVAELLPLSDGEAIHLNELKTILKTAKEELE